MDKKAKGLIATVGIVLVVLVAYTLVTGENQKKPAAEQNPTKYLFIEVKIVDNGTVISGMSYSGKNFIEAPTYELNGSVLRSSMPPELDSSFKAIYGSYYELAGDAGSGIASDIYPIKDYPYTQGNISILDIQGDEVTLSYDNNSITLLPGDPWKTKTHHIESDEYAVLNITSTTVISNYGKVAVTPIENA